MYHAQNYEMRTKTAVGNSHRKTSFRIPRLRWKNRIKMKQRSKVRRCGFGQPP